MAVPLVNATVTEIKGGGSSEDYDSPAGADTPRFTGNADAYVTETMVSQVVGEALNEIKSTRLVLDYDTGKVTKRGDTVTFESGGITSTRQVKDVQHFELFGTVKLWLRDE